MIRVLGVLVAVALYIYGIIDVVRTPREEVRSLPRAVWLLVVVLLPVLGDLPWLVFGRTWRVPRRRTLAPDDDPRALRTIGDRAWAERMKRRRGDYSPE